MSFQFNASHNIMSEKNAQLAHSYRDFIFYIDIYILHNTGLGLGVSYFMLYVKKKKKLTQFICTCLLHSSTIFRLLKQLEVETNVMSDKQ